jgi:maleate isomerase
LEIWKVTLNFRIEQIVPSSNTTVETEIPAMFHAREAIRPERFTFHSSRMRMHKVRKEELVVTNKQGLRCAAELADARVDVMSTACLVAIMAMGPAIIVKLSGNCCRSRVPIIASRQP